ncbi:MAG: UbiA family prenyltransferase [Verrucomicrobiota bacterium]
MPTTVSTEQTDLVPLCVDLDGTLIKTDLLCESLVCLLKRNPLYTFMLPLWWLKGRAFLKREIGSRVELDVSVLPYHQPLVDFVREEHRRGRPLFLTTASDRKLAQSVADHLGLFTDVLASNGETNLRGTQKLQAMEQRFGPRGFDYAGNSSADLAVWRGAREAIVVNACPSLETKAARCTKLGPVFPCDSHKFSALFRCLRPHQWIKNFIIVVPTVTAHKLGEHSLMLLDLWAFAVFCLCASGVYVVNDLLDLDADRRHSEKKRRPFAAGDLPLQMGFILGPWLLLAGAALAVKLPAPFAGVVALYFVLTMSYSWWVRQIALLDVFFLTALYTIRLIAGHTATGIAYSSWLLMFSMFIFLSLALAKRYTELDSVKREGGIKSGATGRGYTTGDLEVVASLGTGSGYLAALVLALYVNSPQVLILYQQPTLLLLICPLLLYWISRVWLIAHRGEMHGDPVMFALKDWTSYVIGGLALLVLWLATGN